MSNAKCPMSNVRLLTILLALGIWHSAFGIDTPRSSAAS
jgi:hypothetical protein